MRWGEKPYYSLDYYLKQNFGEKVYKVAIDGGMTCPNRDGTKGTRGCIFCSQGGSGDFAVKQTECDINQDILKKLSVKEQIDKSIAFTQKNGKATGNKFIAYFQSYTNTYAPVDYLRSLYMEALSHPKVAALSIGTRPDCLDEDVLELLSECNKIKPVWVELGLQTIHEDTARFIRRGYELPVFDKAVTNLRAIGIDVIVHVILGLPYETDDDIIETIHYLNKKDIQGIKLQLLHILKDTDLAEYIDKIKVYTEEEYVSLVCRCISELSPDIVVHRITGDGPKKLLLAPMWSANKRHVLNSIAHELKTTGIYQGKNLN
ncbi:MAG: TIGR01212 family radical SAM protein [Lachnospiraceae bacterium]|nr:TIGR01212 family radical SAM protein [Lachnospiraceae bacterium]MBQ2320230.1 TIGR01212 family radical SAM protein [Lachnospiraceae bacterium]